MRLIDGHRLISRLRENRHETVSVDGLEALIDQMEPAEPERKTGRLSNKEWIDFLTAHFDVSRTTAKSMLHAMMQGKREDNFKKQFSGCKSEHEHDYDYERASDMRDYCERYEPTYNPEDGSM